MSVPSLPAGKKSLAEIARLTDVHDRVKELGYLLEFALNSTGLAPKLASKDTKGLGTYLQYHTMVFGDTFGPDMKRLYRAVNVFNRLRHSGDDRPLKIEFVVRAEREFMQAIRILTRSLPITLSESINGASYTFKPLNPIAPPKYRSNALTSFGMSLGILIIFGIALLLFLNLIFQDNGNQSAVQASNTQEPGVANANLNRPVDLDKRNQKIALAQQQLKDAINRANRAVAAYNNPYPLRNLKCIRWRQAQAAVESWDFSTQDQRFAYFVWMATDANLFEKQHRDPIDYGSTELVENKPGTRFVIQQRIQTARTLYNSFKILYEADLAVVRAGGQPVIFVNRPHKIFVDDKFQLYVSRLKN